MKPRPVSTVKNPQQNLLQTQNFYTNWYKYAQYNLIQHQNLYSIWYKICHSLPSYGPADTGLMFSRSDVKQQARYLINACYKDQIAAGYYKASENNKTSRWYLYTCH